MAERTRREAKGAADALYAKLEAQARGQRELLVKQAEGLTSLVRAAGGNPTQAAMLMITDKLPELVNTQVEAIKNLKIDKVTVWDSGTADGTPTTARFLSGMLQSLPPLQNLFEMAGMTLPDALDVRADKGEDVHAAEVRTRLRAKSKMCLRTKSKTRLLHTRRQNVTLSQVLLPCRNGRKGGRYGLCLGCDEVAPKTFL